MATAVSVEGGVTCNTCVLLRRRTQAADFPGGLFTLSTVNGPLGCNPKTRSDVIRKRNEGPWNDLFFSSAGGNQEQIVRKVAEPLNQFTQLGHRHMHVTMKQQGLGRVRVATPSHINARAGLFGAQSHVRSRRSSLQSSRRDCYGLVAMFISPEYFSLL
ncbi:hypothetical protein MSG28_000921 [Choristoneura fumiferana]|uniref:Uncharacterized protein n=1 Tax=Choristoneura fumiferana TaxID=7141 RepID=A0ACC0K2Y2_CHOFU|nr:hypothetical protein MSG28_000921 [Choristoneura fumiferana]